MPKLKKNEPRLSVILRGSCSVAELAGCLGCCYNTAAAKIRNPKRLTLGDIEKIGRFRPIRGADILEAIGLPPDVR